MADSTLPPGSPATRPARCRSWRVSVRGLMILVLVVGGPLGWQARRASIQRRAVAAIKAAGGEVLYDYQVTYPPSGRKFHRGATPPAPAWLRARVGDEWFQDVVEVRIGGPARPRTPVARVTLDDVLALGQLRLLGVHEVDWTDADLARLTALGQLQVLTLSGPGFTEASLETFRAMPRLTGLSFWGEDGQLRPAGLRHLAGMDRLEFLSLVGFHKLEPADPDPLRTLPRLRSLRLSASPTDDRFITGLRGLDQLHSLDLRQTRLTDATLAELAKLPNLQSLNFDGANLTDAGLASLGSMRWLRYLQLDSAEQLGGYTDEGLAHLGDIETLTTLSLNVGKITASGITRLYQLHPDFTALDLSGLRAEHRAIAQILASRPGMNSLNMTGPGVTDAWVPMLLARPGRNTFRLDGTGITDTGVALLAAYPTLEHLTLDGTELTDAGLLALARAPRLWTLSIRGTKVTGAGIAAFRVARPSLRVDTGPLLPPSTRPALSGYQ